MAAGSSITASLPETTRKPAATLKPTGSVETGKTASGAATATISTEVVQVRDTVEAADATDADNQPLGEDETEGTDMVAEKEIFDLKGATINMAVYSANQASRPFWSSGYSAECDMLGTRMDYVEEKYNFKFSLNQEKAQKTNLILNAIAGTYWNDITFILGSWLMECDKLLTPLESYIDLTTPNANINRCIDFVTWNGHYYGVPWQNKVNWDDYILYNRAILQREGLPDIIQLQSDGNWTWEALLDISIKATKDINSDGITDQWGLTLDTTSTYTAFTQRFIASNFGSIITKENDLYRYSLNDPNSINALQFISNLHNVYKSAILNASSTKYKLGQSAMAAVKMANVRTNKSSYPDTSAYALFPKGPNADRHVNFSVTVGGWACGIPLVVNDKIGKEKIARVIYDLCALYDPTFPDYLDDVDVMSYLPTLFSEEDLKTVILEKNITINHGIMSDIYCYISSGLSKTIFTATDSVFKTIVNGNTAAATVIDSRKDIVEATIQDTLTKYNK
ncbi:MAG: extracellular solute-binding protein [Eubacteriales bacterium]|nr:extracellular solute-binding protein [Eubacteriales bacterium]